MGNEIRRAYERNPKPFYIGASAVAAFFAFLVSCGGFLGLLAAALIIGGTVFWTRRN
jgi:hypothetical protein